MSWTILFGVATGLLVVVSLVRNRREEIRRMAAAADELASARARGSHRARLQYPHVDLTRCLGCGTCVKACPEDGVLEMIHGQAVVVHGARCVGHGRCAEECPTGAIVVTLGDLADRRDIPALSERLESPQVPGLFLAGELTGFALIRTAIAQGTAVANEVARRLDEGDAPSGEDAWDLCVVGAGPAGIACSLQAKARGLASVTIEQDTLGGTVSKYPRRKLVMTQPVELPLHGRLARTSYRKEELVELWDDLVARHELPVHTGQRLAGIERDDAGVFRVKTEGGEVRARHVCLALGRRGTPRKLDVPGEELPKVAYGLVDAQSFVGRSLLVVGGGDSAIEAALGLAEQPGNEVTLSYRKHAFFRLKARNEAGLMEALQEGRLQVLYNSQVVAIRPDSVELTVDEDAGKRTVVLPNDEVFVLAGGDPPFPLLEAAGVSFDPADRPQADTPLAEEGAGLVRALLVALALALVACGWLLFFHDYYTLSAPARTHSPWHALLRPAGAFGLGCGIVAVALVTANLAYLMRRAQWPLFRWGSLRTWMGVHVATGIGALILALVHAGMAPRHTLGGHALLAMAILVATGAIGRYFYAFVPRAANGSELALEEVRSELANLSAEWSRAHRAFGEQIESEVNALVMKGHWRGSFPRRLWALVRSHSSLRGAIVRMKRAARKADLPDDQITALTVLARRAQRASLAAAHYEDVRGLLASWRFLHRWIALLLVLLVAFHVLIALRFGGILG